VFQCLQAIAASTCLVVTCMQHMHINTALPYMPKIYSLHHSLACTDFKDIACALHRTHGACAGALNVAICTLEQPPGPAVRSTVILAD